MQNAGSLFELGASLTAARESQRLSLADAEKLTCLRARYLEALEADRFDDLPGHVYARAFLRSYADALGLDAEKFVSEFTARYPEPVEDVVVVVLPRRRRRFPLRLVLVAAGLVGVVAAVAWSGSSPPRRLAPLTTAALKPVPKHPHVLAVTHTRVKPKPKPKPQPLVIHAVGGDCWLLVRRGGESGPVLYEGLLQPGRTLRFRARVWVRLGAPWNVTVHRGAHTFGGLSRTRAQNLVA